MCPVEKTADIIDKNSLEFKRSCVMHIKELKYKLFIATAMTTIKQNKSHKCTLKICKTNFKEAKVYNRITYDNCSSLAILKRLSQ